VYNRRHIRCWMPRLTTKTVIPAQVRAARGLLNWTQEKLATDAGIALSSIREIENEKRAAEPGTLASVRRSLEKAGVEFVAGTADQGGPGVRLSATKPNIIRRPTVIDFFDGMPVDVEFKGRHFKALISREVIEDLGQLREEPKSVWLRVFDEHETAILEGIRRAFESNERWDERGRLRVLSDHFPELTGKG
jgi:transcriptional regulator with XRE-family HTH domain